MVAALALGVFAGGMLTEGCVLAPLWRSLTPNEFLAWYALNGQRLHAFYSPLTSVAVLLAIVAAALSMREGSRRRWSTSLAALCATAAAASFFVYFADANASFAHGTLSAEQVGPELSTWATWHWSRSVLVFTSAALAVFSVRTPRHGERLPT